MRKADSIIVKFLRPKKSIFNKPKSSTGWSEYCETIFLSDEEAYCNGTYSLSGFLVISTPQACIEEWRATPSKIFAKSKIRLAAASVSLIFLSSGTSFRALSNL